jgi:hypothetical protein
MHIEVIGFSATAPSTGAAAAAFTGDSLVVKNSKGAANIIGWWADQQLAGYQQLTFPSGHDTTRGIRTRVVASEVDLRWPMGVPIAVQPQELLTVSIAGSPTAGDVEQGAFLLMYDDLPGVNARLIDWNELMRRGVSNTTIENTITTTAGPGWSGAELITAESDLLHANTDYAIVGMQCSVECLALAIQGPDTGNVRIACPGNELDNDFTNGFFGMLSRALGRKTIPVINSGNKSSTFLSAAQDENAAAVPMTTFLVELR